MGAIDSIKTDDYELTECIVQDFTLLQWTEYCDSQAVCLDNDVDELRNSHGYCGPLADILEGDANLGDVSRSAICSCVRNVHKLPRCRVNGIPLVT